MDSYLISGSTFIYSPSFVHRFINSTTCASERGFQGFFKFHSDWQLIYGKLKTGFDWKLNAMNWFQANHHHHHSYWIIIIDWFAKFAQFLPLINFRCQFQFLTLNIKCVVCFHPETVEWSSLSIQLWNFYFHSIIQSPHGSYTFTYQTWSLIIHICTFLVCYYYYF